MPNSPALNTRSIPSLDIFKFLFSFFVAAIHVPPLWDLDTGSSVYLSCCVARLAVPFYFTAGGYLLFRKAPLEQFDPRTGYRYALRLLRLYGIWNLIYLPQILVFALEDHRGFLPGLLYQLQTFLVSGYVHLWYLKSMALSVLIISLALRLRWKLTRILLMGGVFYGFGLFGSIYYGALAPFPALKTAMDLYLKIFLTTRNGIWEGILFVGIGMLFACRSIQISKAKAAAGFLLSFALMSLEYRYTLSRSWPMDFNQFVFLVPSIFFLFCFVLNLDIRESAVTRTLRRSSTLIYYTHVWIRFPIMSGIFFVYRKLTGDAAFEPHSLLQFTIVLTLSLIASLLIPILEQYRGLRWLKKLY